MPLQHFLPATFIASFSTDNTIPRRDRRLAAGDKTTGNVFMNKASNLAGINDLYTLTSELYDNPLMVDQSLSGYEANLSLAINQLIQREISALGWASTLVPFVAGIMVRGSDFNTRFDNRIQQLGIDWPLIDNTNHARVMEFQRLLAPVMSAQWIVLTTQSDEPLITNDFGYAPFMNIIAGHFGMAIPITLSNILVIVPAPKRILATGFGRNWYPIIDYYPSPGNNHIQLNHILAERANRFIFGPDTSTLTKYLQEQNRQPKALEPGEIGFLGGKFTRAHDLDWYKLVCALSIPPQKDGQYIFINMMRTH
jgi:hypothetical protein